MTALGWLRSRKVAARSEATSRGNSHSKGRNAPLARSSPALTVAASADRLARSERFPKAAVRRHMANLDKRPIRSSAEHTRNQHGDFAEILGRMLSNAVLRGPGVVLTQLVFLRQGELH